MTKLKIGVAIFLVLCLGVLAGSLGTQFYFKGKISHFMKRDHRSREEFLLKRLTKELELTKVQQEAVGGILRETHNKIRQIDRKFRPQIRKILDEEFQVIRETLNDAQKPKFDKFIKNFRKTHRRKEPPPPPPS